MAHASLPEAADVAADLTGSHRHRQQDSDPDQSPARNEIHRKSGERNFLA